MCDISVSNIDSPSRNICLQRNICVISTQYISFQCNICVIYQRNISVSIHAVTILEYILTISQEWSHKNGVFSSQCLQASRSLRKGTSRSAPQRKAIRQTYTQLYEEDFLKRLQSELSHDFERALLSFFSPDPSFDCSLCPDLTLFPCELEAQQKNLRKEQARNLIADSPERHFKVPERCRFI